MLLVCAVMACFLLLLLLLVFERKGVLDELKIGCVRLRRKVIFKTKLVFSYNFELFESHAIGNQPVPAFLGQVQQDAKNDRAP